MLCFSTKNVKNKATSGPRASAPPRKCDPGSLFNSPIAPTATRFKPILFFLTKYVKQKVTPGPRASAPPRKCDPGSLFNSPIAPTATRFKPILFFSIKNSFKSLKIMNKCLGDARGIPRGIPGAAPGHPRGSPGAPGDPRSTAGAPRGKGASREPILGTHFPSKSSKNTMPTSKKRDPGTH